MNDMNESCFSDKMPEERHGMTSKEYYLTKSQVLRRYRKNSLTEDYDENLLRGLIHELSELRQVLNCLRLPWMKIADVFFQGYVELPNLEKKKRLLASRLIALMAKLSKETLFVENMIKYNNSQVKELKQLQAGCKDKIYYSIAKGDEIIYHLSLSQLREIYDTVNAFLEREKTPFKEYEQDDLYPINVGMSISRYADKDTYEVTYDIDACEGDLQFTSSRQMKSVIEQMQMFLERIEGENTEYVDENKGEFSIVIQEDHPAREHVLKETPMISKYVKQSDGEPLTKSYNLNVNGLYLNDLSTEQLKRLSNRIEKYLECVGN